MHGFSEDAGAVGAGTKPVEAETAVATRVRSDAEHDRPAPTHEASRRVAAPLIPPGEFRYVDHGW